MQSIFTDEQLKNMSRENLAQALKLMQEHQTKLETKQKILEEKVHELEFLNALLSDKLTLAQKKQFGSSSEKYADSYVQMNLFNEAEQEADLRMLLNQKWRRYILRLTSGRKEKGKRKMIFLPSQLPM